ncbi:RNA-binding cell elongation regulator Jag/EloR [Dialister micraerophilus]|uniref:RNA-binding protein KhpB n=1 Tax=Dialister micraerophilus DSM 19965 TaxID=888062 RepID=F2BWK8_9FIRM|nr:RNA-binding cell elongation regulator Jag/EloR [Dialister micraerophilus]EGF14875.1 SpoIIIJ-associated protein Jag [Dialister micraerophilus DSM 19965]
MRTVRAEGKTIDEAIAKGLEELGVDRCEAIVNVVEEPSSGLFGLLNKKPAIVEVSAPDSIESLSKPVEVETDEVSAKDTVFSDTEDSKADVSDETSSQVEEVISEVEPVEVQKDALEDAKGEEVCAKEEKKREFVFSEEEQAETAEIAKEFLTNVFKGMNIDVTMEKMINSERILFNLHGEGLGILIGKHGQTLDALQYLTNLAAGKKYFNHYFVMLDVENYRERRCRTLESLARRLAEKAKRTGEAVKLEPMNAAERRIIHLALQNDNEVTTESEGEGRYRHIVISLK